MTDEKKYVERFVLPDGEEVYLRVTSIGGGEWGSITGDINNQTDLIDKLNLKADETQLSAYALKTDLTKYNKSYVTETYKNGTSWYRKWSNGYIEQGGSYTGSGYGIATIALPVSFSDTDYFVVASRIAPGSDFASNNGMDAKSVTDLGGSVCEKTLSSFGMQKQGTHMWYACGYNNRDRR